jgi:hypothetical protein
MGAGSREEDGEWVDPKAASISLKVALAARPSGTGTSTTGRIFETRP